MAKGNDEVDRFMSFMQRFEACTALKPSSSRPKTLRGAARYLIVCAKLTARTVLATGCLLLAI